MTQQTLSVVTDLVQAITVGALGVFAGAMLTEAGVLVPYWRSLEARTFHAWYRANAARLARFFGAITWIASFISAQHNGNGSTATAYPIRRHTLLDTIVQ